MDKSVMYVIYSLSAGVAMESVFIFLCSFAEKKILYCNYMYK